MIFRFKFLEVTNYRSKYEQSYSNYNDIISNKTFIVNGYNMISQDQI